MEDNYNYMEDDYNILLSDEVNMDLDIGVGVSEVEEPVVDFHENEEVDCSKLFQSSEVSMLFSGML